MTRAPLSFNETDLLRAIKAAIKVGLHVVGYEINPRTGSILVHVGKAGDGLVTQNPWDEKR